MNERKRKKVMLAFSIGFIFLCMVCISAFWLHSYRQAAFEHISAFCEILMEADPKAEQQVLSALKEYHSLTEQEINGNDFLSQYGYSVSEFCKGLPFNIPVFLFALFFVLSCLFFISARSTDKQNRKRIAELTDYLEQVNLGTGGTVIQTQEDDFSHLQDEIYKTVTMLYQTKEAAITARKRFAENLENIAHQLKTPITAAFLSLQLMEKTDSGDYAKQIEKQLKQLNRLEESLLALSKIDAGTLLLNYTKVDIYTALNLAADNLNDLLRKENIFVEIPDKGCIEFSGDLEWTMEALINLLKNCMEHSKPGGSIHCDYTGNPLYAEILIWDEGAGFDPEDIPHLFERFYRGKRAVGNGIGIGLALARSVFELQNGTITAHNLQAGGACFEIRVYSH
ncbi:MAG: HAMP domain-containing histidine kinase [Roseburia sp.]|nr:HAMP domain-containing histidine kinase [Roseburia sp.]